MNNKLTIKQNSEDINDLLDKCNDASMEGRTQFSGMTYEQGIAAAIEWITDSGASHPLE